MRYAIISDIHSDYHALINVLSDIDKHNVDKIICLGDMVGYGHEAEKVVREIMSRKIASICGNHERALFDEDAYEFMNPVAKSGIEYSNKALSEESLVFLESLQCCLVENGIRFVHGMPPDSAFEYLHCSLKDEILNSVKLFIEQITFCGHSHKTEIVEIEGNLVKRDSGIEFFKDYSSERGKRYIINVGSVSLSRCYKSDGSVYVIYDDGSNNFKFITV